MEISMKIRTLIKILVSIFLSSLFINCSEKQPELKSKTVESKTVQIQKKRLIFFGDSLTAGHGLINPDKDSFPSILSENLKKDNFEYDVINAGLSGDTSSGGLSRLEWVLSKGSDVFVLELGANDMIRGIDPKIIENNLVQIIETVRSKNNKTKILLVPMKAFPNLGKIYAVKFERVYDNVSKRTNVFLSNFILDKIAGIKEINQSDGIHPTADGHKIMASNIYPALKELLRQ